MEYYSAIKRNEIVSFAEMWVDLETVIWSEVSQKDKDKYHIIPLICGVYKKMIQINLFANQKENHRCREQTYSYQGGRGVGGIGRLRSTYILCGYYV